MYKPILRGKSAFIFPREAVHVDAVTGVGPGLEALLRQSTQCGRQLFIGDSCWHVPGWVHDDVGHLAGKLRRLPKSLADDNAMCLSPPVYHIVEFKLGDSHQQILTAQVLGNQRQRSRFARKRSQASEPTETSASARCKRRYSTPVGASRCKLRPTSSRCPRGGTHYQQQTPRAASSGAISSTIPVRA